MIQIFCGSEKYKYTMLTYAAITLLRAIPLYDRCGTNINNPATFVIRLIIVDLNGVFVLEYAKNNDIVILFSMYAGNARENIFKTVATCKTSWYKKAPLPVINATIGSDKQKNAAAAGRPTPTETIKVLLKDSFNSFIFFVCILLLKTGISADPIAMPSVESGNCII